MNTMTLAAGLLPGVLITVQTTLLAALLALCIAMLAGLARLSSHAWVRGCTMVYVEIFRGTSALVQIFYFFFVLPVLGITLSPLLAGVLALGLNFGAYGSEVVRAAIVNVARGQREAAIALNMTPAQSMWRIILPQAFVSMMPPFGNLLIDLLKATSLLSLVTISDLTFAGKKLVQSHGHITEVYSLLLLFYFVIALVIGRIMRIAEQRVSRGMGLGGAQ